MLPLSRIIRRDQVPDDGLEVDLETTPAERAAMSALLGIPAVESLAGHFTVSAWRGRGLAVKGHVEARVEQTCVVSLEPVVNTISEDVEVYFTPEGAPQPTEAESAADGDDRDIEELIGGRIDVGALAAEHVALGLDPYPRKPGAVFEQGDRGSLEPEKGAFAALSVLKGGGDGG
jgi:uncharacterized metal-binding protein YceD (DUF177 family)